jgi:hypothetical protein
MRAITTILAGGVAAAALMSAAPAAAQYYPGNPGYGYGNGGVIGSIINGVLGGGYNNNGYGGYGYGNNQQAIVSQCAAAVQQRLSGGYGGGYNGYGYGGGYASPYGYGSPYGGNGGARVLGISRVEPRSGGGMTVRGVATSGVNAGYAYGYGYNGQGQGQGQVDLTWKCKTDYRGAITDIDVDRARTNYGQNYGQNYTPYNYDYSQYGYRRY